MKKTIRLRQVFGAVVLSLPLVSQAITLEVDSSVSLLRTSMGKALVPWLDANGQPSQTIVDVSRFPTDGSHPPDEVDIPLSGLLELSITPARTDFISGPIPELIKLTNISVPTAAGDRSWNFPEFAGIADNHGGIYASSNACSLFFGGGSCMSQGNFETYSGTFDGTHLIIDGEFGGLFNLLPGQNIYQFHLSATVVPEPTIQMLFLMGLAGLIGKRRITKSME